MENREDLKSMLPYLPLVIRSSSMFWPPQVVEALKAMSKGPIHSRVDSGEVFSVAIADMRESLPPSSIAPFASHGYAFFFDELMSTEESRRWFSEVVPSLANLLLRFPSLLERHYHDADHLFSGGEYSIKTGLRILGPQEAGVVFLSQELIGALLASCFFCLFRDTNRGAKNLQTVNFDNLFASLYESYNEKQENKIKCIIHYFERICSCMPTGFVSFERKVLPAKDHSFYASYPEANVWCNSIIPLCQLEVHRSGFIEDQSGEALEVDFANRYLGGGVLRRGCVQEEIRFLVSPELLAGMIFMPSMDDNESIEIVGAERFSSYIGYASSFRFAGDYVDKRNVDRFKRRKTRIAAIDALCDPKMRQFKLENLVREINKAYCGFLHQCTYCHYEGTSLNDIYHGTGLEIHSNDISESSMSCEVPSTSHEKNEGSLVVRDSKGGRCIDHEDNVGIVTGNWGCGAFGGDPELKAIIQWLAASQAERPFISYHTFGLEALHKLEQVTDWILRHEWSVGDLWNMLVEYSSLRLNGETRLGFFSWLLPSVNVNAQASQMMH